MKTPQALPLLLLLVAACAATPALSGADPVTEISASEPAAGPPLSARGAFGRAVRARMMGDLSRARDLLRVARTSDPGSARVARELGRVLLMLGQDDEAVAVLENAARLGKGATAGLLELSEAYRRAHRVPDAIDCLLRLHREDPRNEHPVQMLHALWLVFGYEGEGLRFFSALTAEWPDWALAHEALGDFQIRHGDTLEALASYRRAAERGGSVQSLNRKMMLVERKLSAHEVSSDSGLGVPAETRTPPPAGPSLPDPAGAGR